MTQKFTLCYVSLEHNGLLSVVEEGKEKKLPLTLEDILTFATGASQVPPMGWSEQPHIEFKNDNDLPSQAHAQIAYTSQLLMPTTTIHLNTSLCLVLTVP